MALLTLTGVRKNFGAEVIFEDVTFTVHEGDRLGVVGPNGAGKTTLFRVILGQDGDDSAPDAGIVARTRDVTIGHLPQQPDLGPERTVLAETLTALDGVRALEKRLRELETAMEATHDPIIGHTLAEEHGHVHEKFERAGGYRLESGALTVLAGLGVPEALLDRPCGVLSGGERSRVALAKMLLQAPDLMLLDEPTNHLDIEGTEWLEDFLTHSGNAFLVTSHDRTFLDRVTTKTLEVADGAVKLWPGAYAAYEMLKAESLKALLREIDKQQDFLDKERAFIRKHLGSQRSREARGREKRLERFEILAKPATAQQAARLDLSPARPQGNLPLTVEGLTATAGTQTLFRDLSFELLPGDRLGIVGRNGCGKSTLLRLLAGRTRPETGRIDLGRAIDLGWFDQEHALLDRTKTVYSTIHDYKPRWGDFEVRSWLARFNFFAAEAGRGVDLLSGGERARLALSRLLLDRPNVLFLDEPTNHLDIPSRQALEDALQTFTGTLIIVSHDRWFLDRVVTKILWIDPAGTRLYFGNYREAAARRRAERDAGRDAGKAAALRAKAPKLALPGQDQPRETAAKARKRRPLATIEAEIMKLEREKSELMSKLEDPKIYGDGTRVRDINERLGKVTAALVAVEAEWQEYGS